MYLGLAISAAAALPSLRLADHITSRWSSLEPRAGSWARQVGGFALTAALFGYAYAVAGGFTLRLVVDWALIVVLLVIARIDYRRRIIPNAIVLPAAAIALLTSVATAPDQAPEFLLAGVSASAALLVLALAQPGSLGMGDVKMALFLGFALGYPVVLALLTAFLLAGLSGGALMLAGRASRRDKIPLGPFLSAGGILCLLAGDRLIAAYLTIL